MKYVFFGSIPDGTDVTRHDSALFVSLFTAENLGIIYFAGGENY